MDFVEPARFLPSVGTWLLPRLVKEEEHDSTENSTSFEEAAPECRKMHGKPGAALEQETESAEESTIDARGAAVEDGDEADGLGTEAAGSSPHSGPQDAAEVEGSRSAGTSLAFAAGHDSHSQGEEEEGVLPVEPAAIGQLPKSPASCEDTDLLDASLSPQVLAVAERDEVEVLEDGEDCGGLDEAEDVDVEEPKAAKHTEPIRRVFIRQSDSPKKVAKAPQRVEDFSVGQKVLGTVTTVKAGVGAWFDVGAELEGFVPWQDFSVAQLQQMVSGRARALFVSSVEPHRSSLQLSLTKPGEAELPPPTPLRRAQRTAQPKANGETSAANRPAGGRTEERAEAPGARRWMSKSLVAQAKDVDPPLVLKPRRSNVPAPTQPQQTETAQSISSERRAPRSWRATSSAKRASSAGAGAGASQSEAAPQGSRKPPSARTRGLSTPARPSIPLEVLPSFSSWQPALPPGRPVSAASARRAGSPARAVTMPAAQAAEMHQKVPLTSVSRNSPAGRVWRRSNA